MAIERGGRHMEEGEVFQPRPIDRVREGMIVVDAAGEELGIVAYVRRSGSQAVTTEATADTEHEPKGPEPERSELVRSGFIKVDGSVLAGAERYVKSDRIAEVSGNTVRLTLLISGMVTG
jgi:hypothetical protein